MKKPVKILIVIVAIIIALGLLKDIIAKTAVQVGTKAVLGTEAKIGKFKIGILNQTIDIRDFQLFSPEGFNNEVMVDLPQATVKYDLIGLLTGKLHCKLIVLNLKEIVMITNKDGLVNLDELKVMKAQEEASQKETKAEDKKKPSKEMAMQLDKVVLTIGKLVQKDYTKGEEPKINIIDVGIKDKEYENITSAEELATLIFATTIKGTVLKSAAMYGATAALGVGLLPVGVAGVLTSKDSASGEFNISATEALKISESIANDMGSSVKKEGNEIQFKIGRTKAKITVEKVDNKKTSISVSARKLMIPRKQEAESILYKIKEVIEK